MKQLIIDVETTGLSYYKNSLWQIAGYMLIDGKHVDSFNIKCAPHASAIVEEEALRVSGITEEYLNDLQSSADGFLELETFLKKHIDPYNKEDKAYILAYNAPFDVGFLKSFFYNNGSKFMGSYFHKRALCVLQAVCWHFILSDLKEPSNFKLGTIAEFFGIKPSGELHDALVDVDLTYKILNVLKERNGAS